ncbi:MAG: sulfur carrier protein ThiS [Limnochordales bacterium]|nr:sulfur carrier protein ThiS [Limnochordales bacterium]
MRVTVNGEPQDIEPGTTIRAFLEARDIDIRRVAVALNDHIVPRERLGDTRLADGDVLEIIRVVAGG